MSSSENFAARLAFRSSTADQPPLGQQLATLRHLKRFFAQVWRTSPQLTVASIALRLLSAIQPLLLLYVGKLIIDEVVLQAGQPTPGPAFSDWIASGRLTLVGELLLLEFALVVTGDLLSRAVSLVDGILSELHSNTVSMELMRHAAGLDLRHFESSEYQDRLERARRQAAGRNALLAQIFGQGQSIVTIVTLAAGLFFYAPWLILLLFVSLIPAVLSEVKFNTRSYLLNRMRSPERRELEYLRYIGASAETAKEIKLFGLGSFLVGRFRRLADAIMRDNRRLATQRAIWGGVFAALSSIAYYGAYAYIVWRTIGGQFTLGDLAFLSGSFLRLNALFSQLLIGVTQIAGQSLYLDDLFSFFDIRPTIALSPNPKPFPLPIREGIVFENVGFRYPDTERWAVRGLSFEMKAGEAVALVGENGAGKTTIVKLLTRLYDPDEGRIQIDGVDLRDFDIEDLRTHIGVIFQDFIRYSFTAAENIGVGRIEAGPDRPRIEASAEQSLAAPVIEKLPLAYDQPLGKLFANGRDLSGGEWQKVAIARAYMRDAELIILDEPTAALDAKAEAEVFERFKRLARGKTAVLISHRFSTVRMADRILVLSGGAIIEAGSHEELIARRGVYAELFELQAAGYR
ncbi:ABC transporter ATP-binding protein [Mesorhizobium sp. VNQ89]|uniref:ABC transporter ATP-binding protein n=1 Tax=Mesorhizobium quangtriensis TaxID=3157709 RepID=UPI0032B7EDE8